MRISDWSSDVCSSDLLGIKPVNDIIKGVIGWYPVRKRQKTVRKSSRCCTPSLISTKYSIHESVAQSTNSKTYGRRYSTRHCSRRTLRAANCTRNQPEDDTHAIKSSQ